MLSRGESMKTKEIAKDKIIEVNDQNYKTEILKETKPVFVEFYVNWCGHCQALKPTITQLSQKYADKIKFCVVNSEESSAYSDLMRVTGTPTMFLYKGGKVVNKIIGAQEVDVLDDALRSLSL